MFFLAGFPFLQGQTCDVKEIIAVCDMAAIDGNNDGAPDGILNLYDAYFDQTGINIQHGIWFDPNFGYSLNPATGDVSLWDLFGSSQNVDDYTYILFNSDCGDTPALTINLVLGPFSGSALSPIGGSGVNVQVCGTGDVCMDLSGFDLFEALQSSPSPHLNGEWIYEGNSPNFIGINGSELMVQVPYQPGPPLVDQETFTLVYVVPGIAPCAVESRTSVNISVVRQTTSGESHLTTICEKDLQNGLYDQDIDLSDDAYLEGEDQEGRWSGSPNSANQISTPYDHIINLRAIYDNLLATNPRFGVETINFRFLVDQRSAVCSDTGSDIPFIFYEALYPFEQPQPRVICVNDATPSTLDLMGELEFSRAANGTKYDYLPGEFAEWEFVSGPEALHFTPEGKVTLAGAPLGTYQFKYTVDPRVNCKGRCDSFVYDWGSCPQTFTNPEYPCDTETESAIVTFTLVETLYAGEDTSDIEFCTTQSQVDLISLLNTDGSDPVYRGSLGIWTDGDGNPVPNIFTIPQVDGQKDFSFTYTTDNGTCTDIARLDFTVFGRFNAGTGGNHELCKDGGVFNLFDLLTGPKDTNGIWSGPNGYISASYLGEFDPSQQISGDYVYKVPDNGPCTGTGATIAVTVSPLSDAGEDFGTTVCRSDKQLNLYDLLSNGVDTDGEFTVLGSNTLLPNGILNLEAVSGTSVQIGYTIDRNDSCTQDDALITVNIMDVTAPSPVAPQKFCVLDGATLADIQVGSSVNWYPSATSGEMLPMDTLLESGSYFMAGSDDQGCESSRVEVSVQILKLGEIAGCILDLQDGVSPNGDGINDDFSLEGWERIFPNFQLVVFNRNGIKVYEGTKGTPYFKGVSTLSGNRDLPAGVYFYVFKPNDGVNNPFQSTFYLSK